MSVAVKKIEPKEMQSLIERVERAIEHNISLDSEDLQLLLDAIHTLINVQSVLDNKDATLLKLKKLLGMVRSSESRKKRSKRGQSDKNNKDNQPPASKPEVKHHEPQGYKAGDSCPACINGVLEKNRR